MSKAHRDNAARWELVSRIWQKGWKALQEQPLKLQEQLFERSQFLAGSLWMRRRAQRDPRLRLGQNVRIQSPNIVRIVGADASVMIGSEGIIYKGSELVATGAGQIHIGTHCTLGQASIFAKSSVHIGDFALFSWGVHIQDYTPHPLDPEMRRREIINMHEEFIPRLTKRPTQFVPPPEYAPPAPIAIGDDVWLGAHVTVLPGVRIGKGCVVGTGSVVTRDLPPHTVAAGVPAKVLQQLPQTS